jgi:ribosomal protein S2
LGEGTYLPRVNIIDTSLNVKRAFYVINANQKSLKSLLFFVRLLVKDKIIIRRFKKLFFRRKVLNVL